MLEEALGGLGLLRDGAAGGLYVEREEGEATRASFRALTGSDDAYDAWRAFYAEVGGLAEVVAPTFLDPLPRADDLRTRVEAQVWRDVVEQPLGAAVERRFADDTVRGVVGTDGTSMATATACSTTASAISARRAACSRTASLALPNAGNSNAARQARINRQNPQPAPPIRIHFLAFDFDGWTGGASPTLAGDGPGNSMPQDGHSAESAAISSEQNGQVFIVRPFLDDLGQTSAVRLQSIPSVGAG